MYDKEEWKDFRVKVSHSPKRDEVTFIDGILECVGAVIFKQEKL